jgi:carbonyl reductase 1
VAGERWWGAAESEAPATAVVTGAAKGIGFEIARALEAQGLRTVVAARNPEAGAAAAAKIAAEKGSAVLSHQLDITDDASVARFAEWARQELGTLHILVNNAGMAFKGNVFGIRRRRGRSDHRHQLPRHGAGV